MYSFKSILEKYNLELILFIYMIGRYLYQPSILQSLMIDKICVNNYNLDSNDFCYKINLPEIKNTNESHNIQKDAVKYITYQQLILSIPSIIASIFFGPFLDKHKFAPKIVVLLNLFAALFESSVILLNVFFFELHISLILISHIFGIFGGSVMMMTAIFTIAMKSTPLDERTTRFSIFEFALVLPLPASNFISSLILPLKPMFIDYQVRNYVPILLLSIFAYSICLVLVIFTIGGVEEINPSAEDQTKRLSIISAVQPYDNLVRRLSVISIQPYDNLIRKLSVISTKQNPTDYLKKINENNVEKSLIRLDSILENEINDNQSDLKENNQKLSDTPNVTKDKLLSIIFRLSNITDMKRALFKKREHNTHRLLWCVVFIYIINGICLDSVSLIMVPFVNAVYGMTTVNYMKIYSIGILSISLISIFFLVTLNKLDLIDTKRIFIGLFSVLFLNLMRGLFLNIYGLILSYIFGCLMLTAFVSLRSFVSIIIPSDEIGTVLSILSCLYVLSNIIGSFFYGQIFRASFDFYPGLVFILASGLVILAIIVNFYLHRSFLRYNRKINNKKFLNSLIKK